jgi:hypothetical protein
VYGLEQVVLAEIVSAWAGAAAIRPAAATVAAAAAAEARRLIPFVIMCRVPSPGSLARSRPGRAFEAMARLCREPFLIYKNRTRSTYESSRPRVRKRLDLAEYDKQVLFKYHQLRYMLMLPDRLDLVVKNMIM